VASPGLKDLRDQQALKAKRVTRAPRAFMEHKAKGASPALKGHREQREKKAIQALRVLAVRRAKGASPVLKGSRDPQGQREILQTPAACKTLKTAFPNWKRDSRRRASEVSEAP
jgi:hypothetical protein